MCYALKPRSRKCLLVDAKKYIYIIYTITYKNEKYKNHACSALRARGAWRRRSICGSLAPAGCTRIALSPWLRSSATCSVNRTFASICSLRSSSHVSWRSSCLLAFFSPSSCNVSAHVRRLWCLQCCGGLFLALLLVPPVLAPPPLRLRTRACLHWTVCRHLTASARHI